MHRRGAPAVCFSVLASSVIIVAARAGLLSPCVVPAFGLRLIIQSVNEMPPAQIDGIVQGVYFALKRRGLNKIKVLPSFWFLRAKTRENGAFYGSRPAGNAGKPRVFRESNRQTGICNHFKAANEYSRYRSRSVSMYSDMISLASSHPISK